MSDLLSYLVYHPGTGTVMSLDECELVSVANVDIDRFGDETVDESVIIDRIPGYDAIGYLPFDDTCDECGAYLPSHQEDCPNGD